MIKLIIGHATHMYWRSKVAVTTVLSHKPQYERNSKHLAFLAFTVLVFSITSCKKLVEVKTPNTQITSDNVYNNDATAIAVMNGLYSKLSNVSSYPSTSSISTISLWAGLSADEFTLWYNTDNSALKQYYQNALRASTSGVGSEFWANTYPLIYTCNAAIEGLNKSSSLSLSVKRQLLGEAKFTRAYFYFYLVNLYGDVPIVLTTDYSVNSLISRSPVAKVYEQIRLDLNDAKDLLANGYVKNDAVSLYSSSDAERVRPSKAAASTLLSRVGLYTGDWAKAESEATIVISNTDLYDTVPLNQVFLKNSKEAIWQIQDVNNRPTNTTEGIFFNLTVAPTGVGSYHTVYLSQSLLNSFEVDDQRKSDGNWINSYTDASGTYYYPYKYKIGESTAPVDEYPMYLRLGELYLIRAEARARQNNLSGAIADLDVIRNRAGLPLVANTNPGINQTSLLDAINHERRVELFSESGHRWFDLKRTGTVDAVMSTATIIKGGSWQSYQQLYPVPASDLLKNPNMTPSVGY